jgi:TonB family protein
MKTRQNSGIRETLKKAVVLSMVAIAICIMSSCGKSKNSETAADQAASSKANTAVVIDSVYRDVDEMPVFTGGDTAILNYISKNTIYPLEAKSKGIQGKVVVKLVVQKDCSIGEVVVLKSAGPLLDAEAVRVVKTLPKFEKPGILRGKAVNVNFMVPINFTLK